MLSTNSRLGIRIKRGYGKTDILGCPRFNSVIIHLAISVFKIILAFHATEYNADVDGPSQVYYQTKINEFFLAKDMVADKHPIRKKWEIN